MRGLAKARQYTVSVSQYMLLVRVMKDQPVCRYCGEPILVGDRVVTKRTNSRISQANTLRVYHEACYESMFIDV